MAITGGFGITVDLERGIARRWVLGRDGIKRWLDTGEVVPEPRPHAAGDVDDAIVAQGHFQGGEDGREG